MTDYMVNYHNGNLNTFLYLPDGHGDYVDVVVSAGPNDTLRVHFQQYDSAQYVYWPSDGSGYLYGYNEEFRKKANMTRGTENERYNGNDQSHL